MEINEDSYILGYWFASKENHDCWYMMVKKENDKWEGQYTFRYNNEEDDEDDPFSGKDEKRIYNFSIDIKMNEEQIVSKLNDIFENIKVEYNNFHDHFLVKGNAEKFMEITKTKHYLHVKAAT